MIKYGPFYYKMKKIISLFIYLLPIVSYAQSGKLFTVEKGLSNSDINVIFQDKSDFIWIGTDDGLNCYDGAKITKFKHIFRSPNSLIDNNVLSINELFKGNIIIGTARGLQIYNKATETFHNIRFGYKNEKNMGAYISSILLRKDGDILIGTSGHGLYKLKIKGSNYIAVKTSYKIKTNYISGLFEDKDRHLWIATSDNGIMRVANNGSIQKYHVLQYPDLLNFGNFFQDSKGNLYLTSTDFGFAKLSEKGRNFIVPKSWNCKISVLSICQIDRENLYIGTIGHGVKTYNLKTGIVSDSKIKFNTFNFGKSEVHSILKDTFGNLWIGVNSTGAILLPKKSGPFNYIGSKAITSDIIGCNRIISIFKDKGSSLWIGTANDGLYKITRNGLSIHYTPSTTCGTIPLFVNGIYQDTDNSYWINSLVDGLFHFNPTNGICKKVPLYFKNKEMKGVTSIVEDGNKNIWIGVMGGGLFCWNMRTKRISASKTFNGEKEYNEVGNALHNRWISTLFYSKKNKLYIGSCDGLGCLDLKTRSFVSEYNRNRIFAGIIINVIYEDKLGNLWIGTPNGLIRFNEKTKKYIKYTMHDGLPSDAIMAIQNDTKNGLWISTDYGLSHYNAFTNKFTNFYSEDGSLCNEFSRCSSFADSNGYIYFGGTDGVTYFKSNCQLNSIKKPQIRLVGLYINNKSVKSGMKSGIFTITDNPVYESTKFDFACNDNNLTLEFSAMDFYNSERITYAYSINNGPWNEQSVGINRVTFNNMRSGKYVIRVKSIDGDNSSDIKTFVIVIHPAWYASIWAVFIYIILLFISIYLFIYYLKNKNKRQKEYVERQHLEQINEAKLQFFINISHEIRTPLTLIISPLQQLISSDMDIARQKTYCIINRNAQRLLRLINQLMDVRKIDKGQMSLKFSENDIIKLINNIIGDFAQQIKVKNISFEFNHDIEKLNLWVDPSNFDKIIMNVLSNAFKFTPDKGEITIQVKETDMAEIIISNTGSSIDKNEIEKIFERFYQIRNSKNNSNIGTGIGLHLTRSLVELHHGNIYAENNEDGSGCRFIIRLPLGNKHLRKDEMEKIVVRKPEEMKVKTPLDFTCNDKKRRTTQHYILVVEDDEEIRKYVCSELRPEFNSKECKNGKEAYDMILAKKPDLVISDVMMPEMDGFSLCKKIRQNTNINSIPIILLTAKTTVEDNIEGLERGADAYVTKPFNISVLKKTVENLINRREQLRNTYTGKQEQKDKITKIEAKSPDDKLMERIMKVINNNISNPDLNVEMITKEVGISRVHLYRKMKELTNQSMRDFIRNIRLKQAAALLSEKKYSVSEVVEMTGFIRVSNFSTLFKNMYGMSPLSYRDSKNSGDKTIKE